MNPLTSYGQNNSSSKTSQKQLRSPLALIKSATLELMKMNKKIFAKLNRCSLK